MPQTLVAGRQCPRVYRTSGRRDVLDFLITAVASSGANVVYASESTRAPIYLGIESGDDRIGVLVYPFRATQTITRNRPSDEHRLQVRYGAEATWLKDHPLGIDIAGVDTTLVLGVQLDAGILVGLDPLLYDPLPMGISIEFKDADVRRTKRTGWHAWERVNRPGSRRSVARARDGLETLIGLKPAQLLRYVRFERSATALGLDPVLRRRAAETFLPATQPVHTRHALEDAFDLTSQELLEIIASRKRLKVAVRGGVAEHHLLKALARDKAVAAVAQVDSDGPPDADVRLHSGRHLRVECKNGEPNKYANGDGRVEVQKTRASKGDPASRFYKASQFDVLAVCLWPTSGRPRFVYRATRDLDRHAEFPDRLAVMHHIDDSWASRIEDAA